MCVGNQPLKKLASSARLDVGPRQQCINTTSFIVNNALDFTYRVVTHAGCVCNEIVSLHNRHLIDRSRPDYDAKFFLRAARKVMREFTFESVAPVSYQSIIKEYHGPKRMAYVRALEEIETYQYDRRWAHIQMFVKPDKYPEAAARDKAPRAIQYRKPAFNLLLAHYLKPIEQWFYEQQSPNGFRFVAKGLNNVQRGQLLLEVSNTYENPAYVLLDHSAFDSTINVDHLKATHKFYSKLNGSRFLQKLLKSQLHNKGWTKHGIRYSIDGTRMSGDYDTALGNCFVNYVTLRSWLRFNQVKGDIILDGDDSIVIVERRDLHRLDMAHFSRCGFETKFEVVHDICEVEFCQSKFLPTSPPRFSRNPVRALSRLNISLKAYHGSGWARYQAGIGLGEMATNQGVPILYPIGEKLAKLSKKPILDTETTYKMAVDVSFTPITDEVREAYYRAWGITPDEQVRIESTYTPRLSTTPETLIQQFLSLPDNATDAPLSFTQS